FAPGTRPSCQHLAATLACAVPVGTETVMVSGISAGIDSGTRMQPPPAVLSTADRAAHPPAITGGYRPDASYHPQLQPPGTSPAGGVQPSQGGGPYGIPPGQTLADVAGGTQAQPF